MRQQLACKNAALELKSDCALHCFTNRLFCSQLCAQSSESKFAPKSAQWRRFTCSLGALWEEGTSKLVCPALPATGLCLKGSCPAATPSRIRPTVLLSASPILPAQHNLDLERARPTQTLLHVLTKRCSQACLKSSPAGRREEPCPTSSPGLLAHPGS